MTPSPDPAEARRVFWEALDRPAGEREAWLAATCSDGRLRAEVLSLLEHAATGAGGSLDRPVVSRPPPSQGELPERIGRFRILRRLGAGGMGEVFEAEQDTPHRIVALKRLRAGSITPVARRRLQLEAEMLARLRHPAIAQLYETGQDDDGSPYLVMEAVPDAVPITVHAARERLGTRAKLELFGRVCEAVQHGHRRGVIHRDLKPGNILVTSDGDPKIIDFGVARALDRSPPTTALTDVGQLIGTMQYMSPEQVTGDPADIDTRTDVYALGVVLYELLTGELPYDVTRLAVHEATRLIVEQAPVRPSTHDRRLRGDLETIALKALAKEPDRRYAAPGDLATDIRRYLGRRPIAARRPSAWYQAAVFARRHPGAVAGLGLAVLAMAGALVVVARQERAMRLERDEAVAAAARADRSQRRAEAVSTFLVHDLLGGTGPTALDGEATPAGDPRLSVLLERAEARLATGALEDPDVEATVRAVLGRMERRIGREDEALDHLERAWSLLRDGAWIGSAERIELAVDLAGALRSAGRFEQAAARLERERGRVDIEPLAEADLLLALALVDLDRGETAAAETAALRAVETMEAHDAEADALVTAIGHLARIELALGRRHTARARLEGLLSRPVFERASPFERAQVRETYGTILADDQAFDAARRQLELAVAARAGILPEDHPARARGLVALGVAQLRQRDLHAAIDSLSAGLETYRRALGDDHGYVATAAVNLGIACASAHRLEDAVAHFEQAESIHAARGDPDHPTAVNARSQRGLALWALGRADEAETCLLDVVRAVEAAPDRGYPPQVLDFATRRLAVLRERDGRGDEAAVAREGSSP